ncbi:hypothetical protein, partial [Cronobacter sakazakii]|uniref:hypothetical protein n=1 Tax=Cronobacter sakazakii TaxID=28141 RepID=UPI001F2B5C4A
SVYEAAKIMCNVIIYVKGQIKLTCLTGAQCSPRPACPLKGALLMQVQRCLRPRRDWRWRWRWQGVQARENACKTMHLMHAWLFYKKSAGFAGIFERTTARPVLHDGGYNSGSVQA